MRLIDADELIEHVWRDRLDSRERIADLVKSMPSAEPQYTEQDMRDQFNAGYACGMEAAQPETHEKRTETSSAQPEIVRGCGEQKCYHPELKRTVKRMTGKNDGLEKKED